MGKEDEVRIGDKEFDIISIGDTYKHELSADERERLKEKKLEGKEELDAIVRHRKLNRIRTDVSGNVVFSKPHTGPHGIHVDLKNEAGQKVGKLAGDDLLTTTSESIAGSNSVSFPYPSDANTHTVGVYGNDRPETIDTSVKGESLRIHASSSGTVQVAFW